MLTCYRNNYFLKEFSEKCGVVPRFGKLFLFQLDGRQLGSRFCCLCIQSAQDHMTGSELSLWKLQGSLREG